VVVAVAAAVVVVVRLVLVEPVLVEAALPVVFLEWDLDEQAVLQAVFGPV
jgi:hypothetical protein